MGMFDTVVCEHPLPDGFEGFRGFQTKDLGSTMGLYVITEGGRLVEHVVRYEDHPTIREWHPFLGRWRPARVPVREKRVDQEHHGDLLFYGSRHVGRERQEWEARDGSTTAVDVPLRENAEFRARFTEGQLVRIDALPDERGKHSGKGE